MKNGAKNLYFWEHVKHATSRYHEGGGVLVCAESLTEAIALAGEQGADLANEKPDEFFELKRQREKGVWIMPDAGCC